MSDTSALSRELYLLEDENNPYGSKANTIWPLTSVDQVFDPKSPTNKTLRTILAELREDILSGGIGNIVFPVTTVNGERGDVVLTKDSLGLGNVDNTKDSEKPLSEPQRSSIMDILNHYEFHVDLSEFHAHLQNSNNPHGVNFQQIDADGSATEYINRLIAGHNSATGANVHRDIRNSINLLRSDFNAIDDSVTRRLNQATEIMAAHYYDADAHADLFQKKEDLANRAPHFLTPNHYSYPTTQAVVDYVSSRLVDFRGSIANPEHWIEDIVVVNSRSDLPLANARSYRKAYFICHGLGNQDEVAICRLNPDGRTYAWDYSTFSTYTKYNQEHFLETGEGLSINTDVIASKLMDEGVLATHIRSSLSSIIPDALSDYYRKDQIDSMHLVNRIHILQGTTTGTIRFYVNDDPSTMSDDIRVNGLNRLAFLESITESELEDQSVHSRHILNRAVQHRHLDDQAVGAENLRASYGSIFGNFSDSDGMSVKEVPLENLAEKLDPFLSVHIDNLELIQIPSETVTHETETAFHNAIGWYIPESHVNLSVEGGNLVLEFDDGITPPEIYIDSNGELILHQDDSNEANTLSRFNFEIAPDWTLVLTINDA